MLPLVKPYIPPKEELIPEIEKVFVPQKFS